MASCVATVWLVSARRRHAALARPKSRILAWPRLVTKMLAGLMSRWMMPLAWAASRASAISMASCEQDVDLERTAVDAVLQGHAFEKLHGDEGLAVVFADLVDGADVGMVQRRGGAGFALEALERLRVLGNDLREGTSGRRSGPSRMSSAL